MDNHILFVSLEPRKKNLFSPNDQWKIGFHHWISLLFNYPHSQTLTNSWGISSFVYFLFCFINAITYNWFLELRQNYIIFISVRISVIIYTIILFIYNRTIVLILVAVFIKTFRPLYPRAIHQVHINLSTLYETEYWTIYSIYRTKA